MKKRFCLLFLPLIAIIGNGCGDITPVWKDEVKLDNFTLYYSEPCEFKIDIEQIPPQSHVMLEFVLTYYVGITRNVLPLFIVLEDEDHNVTEFTTKIVLKDQGEWLGIPSDNEIDYTLTHMAIEDFVMSPGRYTMKIYANDDQKEKVYGVVNIAARIYEIDVLLEE